MSMLPAYGSGYTCVFVYIWYWYIHIIPNYKGIDILGFTEYSTEFSIPIGTGVSESNWVSLESKSQIISDHVFEVHVKG